MYKQLRDWMIYGILRDKYDEFFICPKSTMAKTNNDEIKQVRNQDNELGIDGFTLAQLSEVEDMITGAQFSSFYSEYTLNSMMFPSYLTLKTANKILFTGEALQLFHNTKDGFRENNLNATMMNDTVGETPKLQLTYTDEKYSDKSM